MQQNACIAFEGGYLSKKLVGNEIIRWNIWLFACEADVLLWVQQGSPDTWKQTVLN